MNQPIKIPTLSNQQIIIIKKNVNLCKKKRSNVPSLPNNCSVIAWQDNQIIIAPYALNLEVVYRQGGREQWAFNKLVPNVL